MAPLAESLQRAPAADVKAWLHGALVGYLKDKDRSAFAPFEGFIGLDDFLGADINQIYRSVPAKYQGAWRLAVSDLIAELPATQENAEALDVLLDVVRMLPAYEIFSRAANRLRSQQFASLKGYGGQTLFERTLRMAIDLCAETMEIRDLLLDLARSKSFDPNYAGLTFIALSRSDPDRWTDYLDLLRPRLALLIQREGLSQRARSRLAAQLLAAVGLGRILEKLGSLRKGSDSRPEKESASSDDWLLGALFLDQGSLVGVRPDGQDFYAFEFSSPFIALKIPARVLTAVIVHDTEYLSRRPSETGAPVTAIHPDSSGDAARPPNRTYIGALANRLEQRGFVKLEQQGFVLESVNG